LNKVILQVIYQLIQNYKNVFIDYDFTIIYKE
jgi:hypothetical protein